MNLMIDCSAQANARSPSASDVSQQVGQFTAMVTVIVPTCNRPQLLAQALASILDQSFQKFEIIVVNDGGCDVQPVLANIGSGREKISLLTHESSRGAAAARNTGLRAAKGKYIAYLDDDDIYLPGHLEVLVTALEQSGHAVAYSDASCLRSDASEKSPEFMVWTRTVPRSNDWDNDRILYENFVPMLCFMHDISCLLVSGYFDESLSTHEDWDMWIRLSRHYQIHHVRRVTCEYRRMAEIKTLTNSRKPDFIRTLGIIYDKHRLLAIGKAHVLRKQRQRIFREIYGFRKAHIGRSESAATKRLLMRQLGIWRYAASFAFRKVALPILRVVDLLKAVNRADRPIKGNFLSEMLAEGGGAPLLRRRGDDLGSKNDITELLSPFARHSLKLPLRDRSAWVGHSAFGYDLVCFVKPQVLVELGTHAGYSYFSFCHAVKDEGLKTRCHAVDTWYGDEHAGYYDNRIYESVQNYNIKHFAMFSSLLQMTFDEAARTFGDNSIDILHIDGLHLYEAVKHDWETWWPKVRTGGLVLFHDIAVTNRNFGVWRLWKELSSQYPSFAFEHASGLGVLCKGAVPTNNKFLSALFGGGRLEGAAFRCYYRAQYALDEGASTQTRRGHARLPGEMGAWILKRLRPSSYVEIESDAGLLLEYMCENVRDAVGFTSNPFGRSYFQSRNPGFSDRCILATPPEVVLDRTFEVGCSVEMFQDFSDDELRPVMRQLALRCRYFVFSSNPQAGPCLSFDKAWGHVNRKQPEEWDAFFMEFDFKRMAIDVPVARWARCYENIQLSRLSPGFRVRVGPIERLRLWIQGLRWTGNAVKVARNLAMTE